MFFAHRQVVEKVVALKDYADVAFGQLAPLLALHVMDSLRPEPVFALPVIIEQREHIQ